MFAYAIGLGLAFVLAAMGGLGSTAAGVMTKDVSGYIFAAATSGVEALVSLVATVGMASLYFELRRVKDGVGVDELARVFD